MRASDMNMFVVIRAFVIALLYFYVLNLSIIVTVLGRAANWLVVGGWALLVAVLLVEKYTERKNGMNNIVAPSPRCISTFWAFQLS